MVVVPGRVCSHCRTVSQAVLAAMSQVVRQHMRTRLNMFFRYLVEINCRILSHAQKTGPEGILVNRPDLSHSRYCLKFAIIKHPKALICCKWEYPSLIPFLHCTVFQKLTEQITQLYQMNVQFHN